MTEFAKENILKIIVHTIREYLFVLPLNHELRIKCQPILHKIDLPKEQGSELLYEVIKYLNNI